MVGGAKQRSQGWGDLSVPTGSNAKGVWSPEYAGTAAGRSGWEQRGQRERI